MLLVKHRVQHIILGWLASFPIEQPLRKQLVQYLVGIYDERPHPAPKTLQVGRRDRREEVRHVRRRRQDRGLLDGVAEPATERRRRRPGVEVDGEHRPRQDVHGRGEHRLADGEGLAERRLAGDVAEQLPHLVLPQRPEPLQPARREQLRRAEPPHGAPLGVRRERDDGVGAVPVGVPGVDDGAVRQGGVVPLEDLARSGRRGDHDRRDDAEAEGRHGPVALGEASQGAVGAAPSDGEEVADDRQRQGARGEVAASGGDQLEGVRGDEDETEGQHCC